MRLTKTAKDIKKISTNDLFPLALLLTLLSKEITGKTIVISHMGANKNSNTPPSSGHSYTSIEKAKIQYVAEAINISHNLRIKMIFPLCTSDILIPFIKSKIKICISEYRSLKYYWLYSKGA